jgi:tetratricopeptide (TPR) repeat protein
MKKIIVVLLVTSFYNMQAQTETQLLDHYQAYYQAMRTQGDVQGVINALTHINVLAPNTARKDTLAYIYMSEGKHMQALNTIGIEQNANDSDMAVEIKAVSLKSLNQAAKAIPHFEELQKRSPSVLVAYELADLKIITNDLVGAKAYVDYGMTNAKDDVKINFYETQYPYQVSSRAAFTCLKGLIKFKENASNADAAIALMDQALAIAPNFNLAKISKDALVAQKTAKVKN